MRYRLRTLLILLGVGPPLLAWAWFYTVPIVTSLVFLLLLAILAACLFFRTLLWAIEGLLVVAAWLLAAVRHATRRKRQPSPEDAVEFSLSRFAANMKARDRK
jgi:positive regulator of sigma E activity